MYDIAAHVARWLADGRTVHTAQVVATRGFSSTDPAAALAWTENGESVGGLFPKLDAELVSAGAGIAGRVVEQSVSDDEAVAAGLSCGGLASVLVQPADGYPDTVWELLAGREPLCLVTPLVGDSATKTEAFTRTDVREAVRIAGAHDAPRLFARGTPATALVREGEAGAAVIALWPPTAMLVVGDGNIATALADLGGLLGWRTQISNDATEAAAAAAELTESDAFVVLSHNRAVDVPALEAVLAGRAGYVGGLGSRPTQSARRDGLLARGVSESALARVYGPAGLDVDAHTPGEIAVSIVAEILAARAGTSGAPISRRSGPVHTGGVHAPPPRYDR